MNRSICWLFFLVPLLACLGCSGANRPDIAPVSGTVTFNGEPVADAHVTFFPTGPAPRMASGITDSQGRFQLTTFDTNDGAMLGEHIVTISKPEAESASAVDEMDAEDPGAAYDAAMQGVMQETYKPENLLPEKYANKGTSPLKRTVTEGSNEFNIDLSEE